MSGSIKNSLIYLLGKGCSGEMSGFGSVSREAFKNSAMLSL